MCWLPLLLLFSAKEILSTISGNITSAPYQPSVLAALSSEHSSGRRWKNRRKTQTFLPSPIRQMTPQEEAALFDQLGYIPPNICSVSARSSGEDNSGDSVGGNYNENSKIDTSRKGVGRPIAIQSYPLLVQSHNYNKEEESNKDNKHSCTPFPTLYWLTCPHVSRAISEIERIGYVKKFQLKLEDDASLAKEWWQCHEDYAAERWNLLSESDKEWLVSVNNKQIQSMREILKYSGVAGADHRRLRETVDSDNIDASLYVPSVKCLHSHYAHFRSQKESENTVVNIVGKWTHELLMEGFPFLLL